MPSSWHAPAIAVLFFAAAASSQAQGKKELPPVIDPSSVSGADGFLVSAPSSQLGASVHDAGDVNGDGIADFVVGSPVGASSDGAGQAHVLFGRGDGFPSPFDPATLDGRNGFTVRGNRQGDALGAAVGGGGDLNGDGLDDVVVGSPGSNRAFVVFGSSSPFPAVVDASALDGRDGFALLGSSQFGFAVASAGDFNGDGLGDLVVSACSVGLPDGSVRPGKAYVVFGRRSFGASLDVGTLDGSNGFLLEGEASLGDSVSSAGDFNGDGLGDIIVGASQALGSQGRAFVVFGSKSPFPPKFHIDALNGDNGFGLIGMRDGGEYGIAVSSAGDMNGDGFSDIVVGGPNRRSQGKFHMGKAYVIFGAAKNEASFNYGLVDGVRAFILYGAVNQETTFGSFLSGGKDFNGDGLPDIVVGDPSTRTGTAHVVFGSRSPYPALFDATKLDGSNGVVLKGCDKRAGMNTVAMLGNVAQSASSGIAVGASNAGRVCVVLGAQSADASSSSDSSMAFALGASASVAAAAVLLAIRLGGRRRSLKSSRLATPLTNDHHSATPHITV